MVSVVPLTEIYLLKNVFKGTLSSIIPFIEDYEKITINLPINNQKYDKNFKYNKDNWRRRKDLTANEAQKFIKNIWKPHEELNDIDKLKHKINSSLNKLCVDKFTILTKQILDELQTMKCMEIYDILCDLILEKIIIDKSYLKLYANLCHELKINKRFQKNIFSISQYKDTYFWSINSLKEHSQELDYQGAFLSEEDALNDALTKINFENQLLNKMQNKHYEFYSIINDLNKYEEENLEQYITLKNHIINFYSFMVYLHSNDIIHDYVIYKTLNQLLFDFNNDDSLDIFCEMYKILNKLFLIFPQYNKKYFKDNIEKIIHERNIRAKTLFDIEEIMGIVKEVKKVSHMHVNVNELSRDIKSFIEDFKECSDFNLFDDYNFKKYDNKTLWKNLITILIENDYGLIEVEAIVDVFKHHLGKFDKNVLTHFNISDIEIDYPHSKIIFEKINSIL